ncbi:low-density lipoprotein receptor class A domain-containing protein 4 isoform X3 [Bos taurus]|uniref:low-density lipoprotein receptor class A domain-containing protein 4 isoform X3 n=1 Tax=Bos taurus TaxID=9913 RepID=UPI000572DC9B|nr:low-density lipoprotein receptor class A domain-containing protein 4 isoform X3 [Bos taurus]
MQEAGSQATNAFTAELEFAQVVVVVVVVTVMVVVIFCLLNHYRVSTRSFIHRPGQGQRQEDRPQLEGCLWPSDGSEPRPTSETMYAPRCRDGVTAPPFLQRDRFSRFQPTYPYVQHEIDLPPTISLSDGEEPPPYQGPCTLQLRDPEQQMELNRESVRAPPNRTVFDSDLIGVSVYSGGPCPPSSNSGISASTCSSTGRMAGPPPAYSEAMGHYPAATPSHPQHSSAHRGSRLLLQREGPGARSCPTRARTGNPGSASDL